MTPRFTKTEKATGFLILITVFAFMTALMLVGRGQRWFRLHHSYFVIYPESYRLQPGAKVRLLGTEIGYVTRIELTEEAGDRIEVKVEMGISADYSKWIRTDSIAAVKSPTVIGSEFIDIIPGSSKAEVIDPGGEIPGQGAKQIIDYLEEYDFDHKMKKLDEVLENLADILWQFRQPDGGLQGSLSNIKALSGKLADGDGTLGKIITQDDIYMKINQDLDQVEKILASIQKTADNLNVSSKSIRSGAQSVKKGAGSLKEVTGEIEGQLPEILDKVQNILKDLEKAMSNAPDISQRARQGMRDVNDILESVKKNILIRGGLPKKSGAESHGLQIRGE